MKSYGINIGAGESRSCQAEELTRLGYTIVPGVLNSEELRECRDRLDEVYRQQVKAFGAERLEAIKETNLARLPFALDGWFLRLVNQPPVVDLVREVIGPYVTLHLQNGILNSPEEIHHQTAWHRDLPYQEWVSSKPLAVSALFCVDDFNGETGGTFVLPGSHREEGFPSAEYLGRNEIQVEAAAGGVIVFDAMLYHRAGTNRSRGMRRGINHVYTIPLLRQQIDIPAALGKAVPEDPELRRLLGYDVVTPNSVADWREQRVAKA